MNRINSELIKKGRILMSFSVTETSCDDTSIADRKKIREPILVKSANEFCHHFDHELWVCYIKSDLNARIYKYLCLRCKI